jgi:hypothetical protein
MRNVGLHGRRHRHPTRLTPSGTRPTIERTMMTTHDTDTTTIRARSARGRHAARTPSATRPGRSPSSGHAHTEPVRRAGNDGTVPEKQIWRWLDDGGAFKPSA